MRARRFSSWHLAFRHGISHHELRIRALINHAGMVDKGDLEDLVLLVFLAFTGYKDRPPRKLRREI